MAVLGLLVKISLFRRSLCIGLLMLATRGSEVSLILSFSSCMSSGLERGWFWRKQCLCVDVLVARTSRFFGYYLSVPRSVAWWPLAVFTLSDWCPPLQAEAYLLGGVWAWAKGRLLTLGFLNCSCRCLVTPTGSGNAPLVEELPLRYCSDRFAMRKPCWKLPGFGHVEDLLTLVVKGLV